MFRLLTLAALFAVLPGTASSQELRVLRIRVTLTDAVRGVMPVPRHALLISDDPPTSSPRRVVMAPDGTLDVRLRPGRYIVESDEPVVFGGKAYLWTQTVEITAERDAVLELTAENADADVGPVPVPGASPAPPENDPSLLLPEWKDSVVAVWTPDTRASGFVVDAAAGLVVTNQRAIGPASAVEVQLTPSIKVAARVLAADRVRDVTVLWIDPAITVSVRPVPLGCTDGSSPISANGQRVIALGSPLRGQKDLSFGEVVRVDRSGSVADLRLAPGSTGGPVFGAAGDLVGISSLVGDQDDSRGRDARIVSVESACEVVRSAEAAMKTTERPVATLLPVEPLQPFPSSALDAAVPGRLGNLSAYRTSSSDFDVVFLTPTLIYGSRHSPRQEYTRGPELQQGQVTATDFGGWSDYFVDVLPVLVVRVTPKMVESLWMKLARGAAYTQGAALPPIKSFKPGFLRMRAMCGDVEVLPIHPFTIEQRVSETDAIREGLYVFDPDALGPHCKSVKLVLYSEKEPAKADSRAVDPQLIERIWQDFAPYRLPIP